MYKNRSLKHFASASKMVKLLASRYKQSIDKGLRLYNEIARTLLNIRIILYREGRDHEINNQVRRRKYMNELLPDYRAFWTGYINVLARLEDMTRYVGNTIKKIYATCESTQLGGILILREFMNSSALISKSDTISSFKPLSLNHKVISNGFWGNIII